MNISVLMVARALHLQLPFKGCRTVRDQLLLECLQFMRSGFADKKFVSELCCGEPDKFWSSVSESLVYQKLLGKAFLTRAKPGAGPDFLIGEGAQRIWVEVICPAPIGISERWLNPVHGGVFSKPANEILLRWTHAIKTKADRLIGTAEKKGYLEEGVVQPSDAYVIAINGCRMRHGPFPELEGISQYPYAVEAVFPVGPMGIRLDGETLQAMGHGHQQRWTINKPNALGGVDVPTYAFLDPRYRSVSAIWALDANGFGAIGNVEPSVLVHNPNAINPIKVAWLGVDQEFRALRGENDDWVLGRA